MDSMEGGNGVRPTATEIEGQSQRGINGSAGTGTRDVNMDQAGFGAMSRNKTPTNRTASASMSSGDVLSAYQIVQRAWMNACPGEAIPLTEKQCEGIPSPGLNQNGLERMVSHHLDNLTDEEMEHFVGQYPAVQRMIGELFYRSARDGNIITDQRDLVRRAAVQNLDYNRRTGSGSQSYPSSLSTQEQLGENIHHLPSLIGTAPGIPYSNTTSMGPYNHGPPGLENQACLSNGYRGFIDTYQLGPGSQDVSSANHPGAFGSNPFSLQGGYGGDQLTNYGGGYIPYPAYQSNPHDVGGNVDIEQEASSREQDPPNSPDSVEPIGAIFEDMSPELAHVLRQVILNLDDNDREELRQYLWKYARPQSIRRLLTDPGPVSEAAKALYSTQYEHRQQLLPARNDFNHQFFPVPSHLNQQFIQGRPEQSGYLQQSLPPWIAFNQNNQASYFNRSQQAYFNYGDLNQSTPPVPSNHHYIPGPLIHQSELPWNHGGFPNSYPYSSTIGHPNLAQITGHSGHEVYPGNPDRSSTSNPHQHGRVSGQFIPLITAREPLSSDSPEPPNTALQDISSRYAVPRESREEEYDRLMHEFNSGI